MSPFSHARKTPVRCATSSDSEIGTQMMERTPPPQAVPSLLSVSAAALRFLTVSTLRAEKAHPFAVVACYTALRTDLFLPKNQHQATRRETLSDLNRTRWHQMQGGRRRRSGATKGRWSFIVVRLSKPVHRTSCFYTKISKIVPRRPAFYVRHRRRGRQMQGGWRES